MRASTRFIAIGALLAAAVAAIAFSTSRLSDSPEVRVASGPDGSDGAVLPDTELIARFGPAVWRVEGEGCGWRSTGTGFAIDAHHVVTNRHVIANDSSPVVRSPTGTEHQGRVIGRSETPDVAVIVVEEALPVTINWAPTLTLAPDEDLLVLGYPRPKHDFTASPGSILNFQPAGSREAVLADAFVEKGNSGGPALRSDGTSAGVVTQMALRDDDGSRVGIIFTAETVQAAVERFIARPTKVLSDCGFGPDYVPPVPEEFEIPAPPPTQPTLPPQPPPTALATTPPTEQSSTTLATPSSTSSTAPTSTTKPCPNGQASVAVDQIEATPSSADEGWWVVSVTGSVDNETTDAITIEEIVVTIDGDPPQDAAATPDDQRLEAGVTTGWTATTRVYSPNAQPSRAEVTVFRVDWADGRFLSCPPPKPA